MNTIAPSVQLSQEASHSQLKSPPQTGDLKLTDEIQVQVICEYHGSAFTGSNGREIPAGWRKPVAWPPKADEDASTSKHSLERTQRTSKTCIRTMSLRAALSRTFDTPAYLVPHAPTKAQRRLNHNILTNTKALEWIGGSVVIDKFIVDVDDHSAPENETEEERYARVEAWFQDEIWKIEELQHAHPGLIVWRSKNGYRIMGLLPEPMHLRSRADADKYGDWYVACCRYLAREFDIRSSGKASPDELRDFTRLQRVPHDVNKSPLQPGPHEIYVSTDLIGYWDPELEDCDRPAPKRTRTNYTPQESDTLLLQLCESRGLVKHQVDAATWAITCPRVAYHSANASGDKDYDSKTLLYVNGGELGFIECKSDGCKATHADAKSWLSEFSKTEIEAAEKALGRVMISDAALVVVQRLLDKVTRQFDPAKAADTWEDSPSYLTHAEQTELAKIYGREPAQNTTDVNVAAPAANDGASLPQTRQTYDEKYSFAKRSKDAAFGPSDGKLAQIALDCFGRDYCRRIVGDGSKWMSWDGSRWTISEIGRVRVLFDDLAAALEDDLRHTRRGWNNSEHKHLIRQAWVARNFADKMPEETVDKAIEAELEKMDTMLSKLNSVAGRNSVLSLMGDRLLVELEDLDENADEVVFTNVAWNPVTNEFYQPKRESLATRGIELAWREPTEEGRRNVRDYLAGLRFDADTLQFLQRSFGYSMLGRGTQKRFWWFRGDGDTSKSTLIELWRRCMGSYGQTTQTSLWLSKSGNPGHTDALARLRGCRFVCADEFKKICHFDDALMKAVTSGTGEMDASLKGKSGFQFRVRFAAFFSSNFDPLINEDDTALANRLTAVTFTRVFKEGEKDDLFVTKFCANEDNMLALLEWGMQGARDYIAKGGFGAEPQQIKDSRADFTESQVSIVDQLRYVTEQGPGYKVTLIQLAAALKEMQEATGQRSQFTNRQISKIMQDDLKTAQPKKSNGTMVFVGYQINKERMKEMREAKETKVKAF